MLLNPNEIYFREIGLVRHLSGKEAPFELPGKLSKFTFFYCCNCCYSTPEVAIHYTKMKITDALLVGLPSSTMFLGSCCKWVLFSNNRLEACTQHRKPHPKHVYEEVPLGPRGLTFKQACLGTGMGKHFSRRATSPVGDRGKKLIFQMWLNLHKWRY